MTDKIHNPDFEMVMEHDGHDFIVKPFEIMMGEPVYGYYESGGQGYSIRRDSVYGQIVRMKLIEGYIDGQGLKFDMDRNRIRA